MRNKAITAAKVISLILLFSMLFASGTFAAICRREGIAPSLYYKWSKTFLQAGKRRLKGIRFVKRTAMK